MEKIGVTIIIPVYNQEHYLSQCLDSVLEQSYRSFEVIVVNNNSTDNSMAICEQYLNKDKRIRVIYEERQGVSYARNSGIRSAKGKYIAFVDPDDTLDADYLSNLVLNASPYVMPVCEVNKVYTNKIERNEIKNHKKMTKYEKLETVGVEGYTVNKLYETRIIKTKNIFFDEEAYVQEDTLFNYNYVKQIKEIKIINKPLYNYRMRQGSATRKKEDIKTLLKIEDFCRREQISTQKAEYSIIRGYILNKNKGYKNRLMSFLKKPDYPASAKIKIILRVLLRDKKIEKSKLFK